MAISEQDSRLIDALRQSLQSVAAVEFSEYTLPWVRSALGLLETTSDEFSKFVEREDVEEIEAHEALAALRASRADLNDAFSHAVSALDIELAQRKIAGKLSRQDAALANMLNRFHGGEFESLRDGAALAQARAAADFFGGHPEICARVLAAADTMDAARRSAATEGAEAVEAYADLVDARSAARVCYLTARDLVSAALRFEGREDALHDAVPPINEVLPHGI